MFPGTIDIVSSALSVIRYIPDSLQYTADTFSDLNNDKI